MMAFFMLMWLLNATTETQRKGIADYFSPTIPVNRISGGGDGAFGGDSMFSEEALPQNGTGASSLRPTEQNQARGDTGMSDNDGGENGAQDEAFESLNAELVGRGGESQVMENALEHIITRVTDEGLVIEIFATEDQALFEPGTAVPTDLLELVVYLIADIAKTVTRPCCMDHPPLGTRPTGDEFQAVRSNLGRPSSVIGLSMRTPILASVFWFSKRHAFSLGPITVFQRPIRVSTRLR
jgi:chemotaxis protein MotB